jgi:hypothetical protein
MLDGFSACFPCAHPLVVFCAFAALKRVHSGSRFITSHAVTGTDAFLETAEIRSLPSVELFCDQSWCTSAVM